jgi:hypothetical protein
MKKDILYNIIAHLFLIFNKKNLDLILNLIEHGDDFLLKILIR